MCHHFVVQNEWVLIFEDADLDPEFDRDTRFGSIDPFGVRFDDRDDFFPGLGWFRLSIHVARFDPSSARLESSNNPAPGAWHRHPASRPSHDGPVPGSPR